MEVIQVFISCPDDVKREKELVKDVCKRLTAIFLDRFSLSFVARDWKEIIGEVGHRPQDIINKAFQNYQIYLGIMWMRFGSPTGEKSTYTNQEFLSGTEEEFELAFQKKKENPDSISLVFFFKQQELIGAKIEDLDQAKKVLEFKNRVSQNWYNDYTKSEGELIFSDLVTDYLTKYALEHDKKNKQVIKREILSNTDVGRFINNISLQPCYIPRTYIASLRKGENPIEFTSIDYNRYLHQIVENENRLVILGNAGSGKSVELRHLALHFKDENTAYIPVYARFSNYVDQDIEDFLPNGWRDLRNEITLIILDGLDEIQPQHFNTAIRKIQMFSERHNKLKMVLSCRTNFYDLPNETYSGTLSGFSCYYIDEISTAGAAQYFECKTGDGADAFIKEIYSSGLIDILGVPYFLNLMFDVYQKEGTLNGGRAPLFKHIIEARFKTDLEHYRTTVSIKDKKGLIISMLGKIAVIMEASGQYSISEDELHEITETPENSILLKYSTVFRKENNTDDRWTFEHNNIKEYLAANELSKLSIEQIKKLVTYQSHDIRIKPSWVNTISFLISISPEPFLGELLNWIIESDQEIVVKFEPEKINEDLRTDIFQRIFNFYKEKDIWLRSNKFNDKELGHFAFSLSSFNFLIQELQTDTTRVVKLNALRVLESFGEKLDVAGKQKIKDCVRHLVDQFSDDAYFIYSALLTLAKIHAYDDELVAELVLIFKNRRNQYIRTGIYKLIIASKKVDEYLNLFLDGIYILDRRNNEDRDDITLGDESVSIKKALVNITTKDSVIKLIQFFSTEDNNDTSFFYYKLEIVKQLINKASEFHRTDGSIFDEVFKFYDRHSRTHQKDYLKIGAKFFEVTNTRVTAIQNIVLNESLGAYYQALLLIELIDVDSIDSLIDGYNTYSIDRKTIEIVFNSLHWYYNLQHPNYRLVEYFDKKLEDETDIVLKKPVYTDFNENYKTKKQQSFNLLFTADDFKIELERFFSYLNKDVITNDDLWQYHKNPPHELEDYFAECMLNFIRDFADESKTIEVSEVRNWVNDDANRFHEYLEDTVYSYLRSDSDIELSESQLYQINVWIQNLLSRVDISNSFRLSEGSYSNFRIDNQVDKLWIFLKVTSFKIKDKKILDFTLFDDHHNNNETQSVIELLRQHFEKSEIDQKVIENLEKGIDVTWIWEKNAQYAISTGLTQSYQLLKKEIKNNNRSEYHRSDVLKALFYKTKDIDFLKQAISMVSNSHIEWTIIDLLVEVQENEMVERTLLAWMKKDSVHIEDRLKAANYLIRLNNTEGLIFHIEYTINNYQREKSDNYEIQWISSYNRKEGIASLISLLEFGKMVNTSDDRFYRLDNIALDGLHNIGISSDENLMFVKKALIQFITDNNGKIQNLNFLHFTIEKMEHQYYGMNKGNYSIDGAIKEVNKMLP